MVLASGDGWIFNDNSYGGEKTRMAEEKPKGMHSIRQITNTSGDSSIIKKTGDLTTDFVAQGVTTNAKLRRGENDHITGSA